MQTKELSITKKNFWDRNAARYDRFMRKNAIAYDQLYALLRPAVWHKTVLEVATGTGQVAKHLLCSADHIEATDASAAMIAQAKRGDFSSKLYFPCRICSIYLMLTSPLMLSLSPMHCTLCRTLRKPLSSFAVCLKTMAR